MKTVELKKRVKFCTKCVSGLSGVLGRDKSICTVCDEKLIELDIVDAVQRVLQWANAKRIECRSQNHALAETEVRSAGRCPYCIHYAATAYEKIMDFTT